MDANDLPKFRLKILGGFELRRAEELIQLSSRKTACLLAYLACTAPRPQPRERLATLLWSSGGDARARHNLRQAISGLRRVLGQDAILADVKTVALRPGVVECDAALLGRLLGKQDMTDTFDAADLYDGALLDDIHVDEPAWNDWLLAERERLSELAVGAMVARAEQELAAGRGAKALDLAHRAVALNRFREDAHRLVLRSLAFTGRKSEAIRRFHDLTAYLAAELGTEPDEETRRIAAGLAEAASRDSGRPVPQEEGRTDTRFKVAKPEAAPPETGPFGPNLSRRRHITVLVCGLMGRDRQTGWSDPEDAAALLRPFLALASELGATFGGHVLSSSSGTVQMVFGYPAAREDDPAQAVRAGLALVHAVARLESLDRAGLSARAGIATGLAVIGSEAEPGGRTKTQVAGDVQAAAYDVLTLADPGTVALSDATRVLLRGAFGLRVIETGTGRNGWQVTGLRDDAGYRAAQRRDAPARRVGRDEEFELLCRRIEQSRAGSGRVVLIAGEAGIGKSRLVGDVLETPSAQEMGLLRYACSEHDRNRPLHPFINRLEWREGMLAARSVEERRDHLEAYVCSASRNPERDMALICDLLGLPANGRYAALSVSPAQKRELLVTAFLEWIAALATRSPLVLHFEDVHWIDPSSQDLLARAVDLVASWPVLLVATMRPDHRPGWISQPHVTMLHLSRFGPVESAELVGVVAGETRLPGPVVEQIVERADGVPLYIKELTRHVLDNRPSGAEATDPQQRPAQNTVPVSLQSSLVARLDQSAAFRKVALAASAIGRSFSFELIAAAADMPDEVLAETLDHMTAAGLILQTGTTPFSKYAFAHALMREAAYGMLLRRQRQALHSRIADRLIGPFSTSPENSPATIARHLSEAGRTTEAVGYYVTAAEIAQRRWANREAADLLDLAIAAHDTLPDSPEMRRQAIDLRFKTKNALIPLADFDRILERLAEARRLVDRHGDERRLCQFFVHISQSLGLSGRATEAIAHGRDAVALAGRLGDRQLLTEAKVFLGTAQYMVADYLGAKASFLDVLDLVSTAPPDTHYFLASFPDITAGAFLAKTLATLGEFDEGQRHGVDAVRRGAALRQPYSQSIAQWCLGDLYLARGEIAKAIGHFEDGLEIARQWDLPTLVAGHTGSLGHAYVLSGNVDAGLPMLEQALSAFDRMRHHLGLSLFLVPLAAASVLAGNSAQARALAARALDLARNGHRCGEAGARYVLAESDVRDGEPARALNHYAEALDLALTRGMRPLAASCHHGLGEAYRRLGDETSARDSLGLAAALHLELGMVNATDPVGKA